MVGTGEGIDTFGGCIKAPTSRTIVLPVNRLVDSLNGGFDTIGTSNRRSDPSGHHVLWEPDAPPLVGFKRRNEPEAEPVSHVQVIPAKVAEEFSKQTPSDRDGSEACERGEVVLSAVFEWFSRIRSRAS